jgi:hypothetical protein
VFLDFFSLVEGHALQQRDARSDISFPDPVLRRFRQVIEMTPPPPASRVTHVLNEEGDPAVEVTDVPLEDKVLLGLGRDARLEVAESFLGCTQARSKASVTSYAVPPCSVESIALNDMPAPSHPANIDPLAAPPRKREGGRGTLSFQAGGERRTDRAPVHLRCRPGLRSSSAAPSTGSSSGLRLRLLLLDRVRWHLMLQSPFLNPGLPSVALVACSAPPERDGYSWRVELLIKSARVARLAGRQPTARLSLQRFIFNRQLNTYTNFNYFNCSAAIVRVT